jgi:hypothetical protein
MGAATIDTSSYITGGGLQRDIARWYPDAPRASCQPPLDVGAFLERLEPGARAALQAFDALVHGGGFPSLSNFGIAEDWTYGVDLAANDQEATFGDEDVIGDIFPLAADGGGNAFVQLLDGRVGIWNHEEQLIEDHTLFASLEECLWILLRIEAVEDDLLEAEELHQALQRFGENTGGAFYRNQLESRMTED